MNSVNCFGNSREINKYLKILFIFLLILSSSISPLSAETQSDLNDGFTASKLRGFTSHLIERGEYYRAGTELYRIKSYYPGYLNSLTFEVTELYILYMAEKFEQIIDMKRISKGDGKEIQSIFKISSLMKRRYFSQAGDELSLSFSGAPDPAYSQYIAKRYAFLSLICPDAASWIGRFNPDEIEGYDELNLYSQSILDKRKSPLIGALSGIVPGMGYVYAGEGGTGIVSMIMIGLGSAVTALSVREKMAPLSILSGMVTAFFYGGSIIGGYRETVKYNKNLMDRLTFRVEKGLALDEDLNELYVKFGVGSSGK